MASGHGYKAAAGIWWQLTGLKEMSRQVMAVGAAAHIWEVSSVLDRECWLNGKDNGCLLVGNAIGVLATVTPTFITPILVDDHLSIVIVSPDGDQ